MHWWLGEPQNQSGLCRDEKNILPPYRIEPQFHSSWTNKLVIILTELLLLHCGKYILILIYSRYFDYTDVELVKKGVHVVV